MTQLSKSCQVLAVACALAGSALPTYAQAAGLVNVDLRNAQVLSNIANHLNVNVSNVPITVQAPISVAANVCDLTVAILATAYRNGGATCTAQSNSRALSDIVQRVMALQIQ